MPNKTTKKSNTKKTSKSKNVKAKKVETKVEKQESENNQKISKPNYSQYITKKSILIAIAVLLIIMVCLFLSFKNRDLDTIALDTHANEVSEWEYEIKDKDIIKFEKKERVGDIEGKTKEGLITEYYTFKALKEGKTTIKFTFKNKNNGSYGEINEYNVVVDKNNKLTITKIDYSK